MVGPSLDAASRRIRPSSPTSDNVIKFLCSYGGKIAPRYPDGKLRYHGGETRLLAVDRSIPFSELLLKLGELCGMKVSLRCRLPEEDLDALVSITSDEDLANLIEEYDRSEISKIRAFIFVPNRRSVSPSPPLNSPPSPTDNCVPAVDFAAPIPRPRFHRQISKPVVYPVKKTLPPSRFGCYCHGKTSPTFMIHNGNQWQ